MRLYDFLRDPSKLMFAGAVTVGTWTDGALCPECLGSTKRRVRPLVMEWEPESDVVGDFVWVSYSDLAVVERVFADLEERFGALEAGPVEMVQDPRLKRPQRVTKRSKPRVWLPYEGPKLVELWATHWVHADLECSSIRLDRRCSTCGREQWKIVGLERWEGEWDPGRRVRREVVIPRRAGKGIFVHDADLRGHDIFHIHEAPGSFFCTERAKEHVEERGYSNVAFREVGDVLVP
jgi:hypothetical protein